MKTLRTVHLYLGCVFAPMLLFFAVTGILQQLHFTWSRGQPTALQSAVSLLSTLHTSRALKSGATLSSTLMAAWVIAMAVSLVVSIVLGVALAFRSGHKKAAILCLLAGLVLPLVVCLLTMQPGTPLKVD
jgi:hypothetical protein